MNAEYTRKSNDINRRKGEAAREKHRRLLALRMETAANKDEIRTGIEMLRNERLQHERDSRRHNELSEAIRNRENRICRLKEQSEIEASMIKGDAYATRLQLDDDARRLSEWLETGKFRLLETYRQEHLDDELPC